MDKLIGTSPNQVPTNNDLGSSAFANESDFVSSKEGILNGLSSIFDITGANEIFIYDTRTDSDYGAWRKRCSHLSWYNEELNTTTRGTRREFPSLAVIVSDIKRITIYDADDPSLPMWMIFDDTSDDNAISNLSTRSIHSGRMVNGMLVVGKYGTTSANILERVHFIKDEVDNIHGADAGAAKYQIYRGLISERNDGKGRTLFNNALALAGNSNTINDMDVKVLDNADIDPETKLPIPTIAVATSAGFSFILGKNKSRSSPSTDDSLVSHISFTGGLGMKVALDNNGRALCTTDFSAAAGGRYLQVMDIPNSGTLTQNYNYSNKSVKTLATSGFPALAGTNDATYYHPYHLLPIGKDDLTFGLHPGYSSSMTGITKLMDLTSNHPCGAHIGADYNTGWMPGTVRLATLCDKTQGVIAGSQSSNNGGVIENGSFSNASAWTLGTDWTISGGQALVADNNRTSDSYLSQSGVLRRRRAYSIKISWNLSAGDFDIRFGGNRIWSISSTYGMSGTKTFTAFSGTDTQFSIIANQHCVGSFDNIEVREIATDRSRNQNPLRIEGMLKRHPVATGADMTSHSGFSSSNYLHQPYNNNLDFTGDFYVLMWIRTSNSASQNCLIHRGDGDGSGWGSGPILQIEFNNTSLAAFVSDSAFTSHDNVNIGHTLIGNNVWRQYMLCRRGTSLSVHLDGVEYTSVRSTRSLTNTNANLWVGERPYFSRPASNCEMSMLRIGATPPTNDQLRRIYDEEKELFKPNAKCTIYGESSNPLSNEVLTDMAYDDDSEILHCASASGRQEFHNLQRIKNTTLPVEGRVAAVNNTIVEKSS